MEITLTLNGRPVTASISPDLLLIDFLRDHGCLSVKRGCESEVCGLCTVLMDGQPILSCSMLTARAAGHSIYTREGLQAEAQEFVGFIADQGADQCGFCNPGFVMNTIALLRENPDPTDDEILIDDDVPLGENPNLGVEAPVGAGIAAAGAALALGAAALTKKRKK